jgi:hypothetical protein
VKGLPEGSRTEPASTRLPAGGRWIRTSSTRARSIWLSALLGGATRPDGAVSVPEFARLFPGGRWIRTLSTAARNPRISEASRASRVALRRRERYDKVPLIPIEPRPACPRRPGRARSSQSQIFGSGPKMTQARRKPATELSTISHGGVARERERRLRVKAGAGARQPGLSTTHSRPAAIN